MGIAVADSGPALDTGEEAFNTRAVTRDGVRAERARAYCITNCVLAGAADQEPRSANSRLRRPPSVSTSQ